MLAVQDLRQSEPRIAVLAVQDLRQSEPRIAVLAVQDLRQSEPRIAAPTLRFSVLSGDTINQSSVTIT